MKKLPSDVERALFLLPGLLFGAFLLIPLVALFVFESPLDPIEDLRHPLVGPALFLSALTTTTSIVVIVVGATPLAWWLARSKGRLVRFFETTFDLPLVVPPAVAGVALLFAFGRHGLGRGILYPEGGSVAFTTAGVVVAQTFVAAPLYLGAAVSAFRQVDPNLIVVARTFGASPSRVFFRLALPLGAPGLVVGATLAWARALGEFGATLLFAGNLEGVTQTLPLAIYTALEADPGAARVLSAVLVLGALGLLFFVRALEPNVSAERRR